MKVRALALAIALVFGCGMVAEARQQPVVQKVKKTKRVKPRKPKPPKRPKVKRPKHP
jgi:hypothetical protein